MIHISLGQLFFIANYSNRTITACRTGVVEKRRVKFRDASLTRYELGSREIELGLQLEQEKS
jgi:hypothetical protein